MHGARLALNLVIWPFLHSATGIARLNVEAKKVLETPAAIAGNLLPKVHQNAASVSRKKANFDRRVGFSSADKRRGPKTKRRLLTNEKQSKVAQDAALDSGASGRSFRALRPVKGSAHDLANDSTMCDVKESASPWGDRDIKIDDIIPARFRQGDGGLYPSFSLPVEENRRMVTRLKSQKEKQFEKLMTRLIDAFGDTALASKVGKVTPISASTRDDAGGAGLISLQDSLPRVRARAYTMALTGGPCAGKSTVVGAIKTAFEEIGWKVYVAPEVASIVIPGGVDFSGLDSNHAAAFQKNMALLIKQMTKTYSDLAAADVAKGKNVLVISDRGIMDTSVFVSRKAWLGILEEIGESELFLREVFYDKVIHMVTAAIGAPSHYTTDGHVCRRDTLTMARDWDRKMLQSWLGHTHLSIIDNGTDFEAKIKRTVAAALDHFGLVRDARMLSLIQPRKNFVVRFVPEKAQGFEFVTHLVTEHLLEHQGRQYLLRQTADEQNPNGYRFCSLHRHFNGYDERLLLSTEEYRFLLTQVRPSVASLEIIRRSFTHGFIYYQLDQHLNAPLKGLYTLSANLGARRNLSTDALTVQKVAIPFVAIVREIGVSAHFAGYLSYALALGKVEYPDSTAKDI